MRRALTLTLLLALTLGVSACGGSKKSSSSTSTGETKVEPANITMWSPFVDPELKTLKAVVQDFEATHPGIHVKVIGGTNDDKIVAAIRGGNAPDVAQSVTSDNPGACCPSGAWADLGPYMEKDGVDESIFPKAPREYTEFEGTRCALPPLAPPQRPLFQKKHPPPDRAQHTPHA